MPSKVKATFIDSRFRQLRERIRLYQTVSGLARTVLILVSACALSFALDWTLNLDGLSRTALLLGSLIGVALSIYHFLIIPVFLPLSNERLGLIVEKRYPELRDALISAIQLARETDLERYGISRALVERLLEQSNADAEAISVREVVSAGRPMRLAALALAACLTAAIFCIQQQALTSIWAQRFLDPFSNARWPRKTHLEVPGFKRTNVIAKGDDLEIRIMVVKGNIRRAFVEYTFASGRRGQRRLNKGRDGTFRAFFPRVNEPLRFRARGGDDETGWFEVKVAERPRIESIQVKAVYPDYTRKPSKALEGGQGDVHAVEGSTVDITAKTDQSIQSSSIVIEGAEPARIEVSGGRSLAGKFTLRPGMTGYQIKVITAEGIENADPLTFRLQVEKDNPPRVKLKTAQLFQEYTAGAVVPAAFVGEDDFGIQAMALVWDRPQLKSGTEKGRGEGSFPLPGLEQGPTKFESSYSWPLEALELKDGETVSFLIEARDFDDLHGPNIGRSKTFTFKVVARSQLEADLVKQEKAVIRELDRLLRQQELTHQRVEKLRAELEVNQKLSKASQESHIKAELEQRKTTADAEKLRDRVDALRRHIDANKIDDFEKSGELEAIQKTLGQLAANEMPEAARELQESRTESHEEKPDAAKLAKASTLQKEAIRRLKDLIKNAGEQDEIDKLIFLARSLANRQRSINQQTFKLSFNPKVIGRTFDKLGETEKQAVRNLRRAQGRSVEMLSALEDRLNASIEQFQKKQPKVADLLEEAAARARKGAPLHSQISRAHSEIGENKLNKARANQRMASAEMEKLLEQLRKAKEAKDKAPTRFRDELKSSLKNLGELAMKQQFLNEKTESFARQKELLEKFRRQLDQLRKKQESLKKETGEKADQAHNRERLSKEQGKLADDARQVGSNLEEFAKQQATEQSGERAQMAQQASQHASNAQKHMIAAAPQVKAGKNKLAAKEQEKALAELAKAEKLTKDAVNQLEKQAAGEMKRLAEAQRKYSEKAKEVARKLSELSDSKQSEKKNLKDDLAGAQQATKTASTKMQQASQQMTEKSPMEARKPQTEALKQTVRAFQKVAKALEKLMENERTRKLAEVKKTIEKLIAIQLTVNRTIDASLQVLSDRGSLDLDAKNELTSARNRERQVLESAGKLRDTFQSEKAIVFAWSMDEITSKVKVVKKQMEQGEVSFLLQRRAREIVSLLRRLQAQLKGSPQQMARRPSAQQGQGRGGRPPGQAPPLVPPLTELQLLRDLQTDVYQQTKAIEIEKVMYPRRPLAPWKQKELDALVEKQGKFARIARELGVLLQEARKAQAQ